MTGERRRVDYVIARSIVRMLSLGAAAMALANLAAFYGAWLWLRDDHAASQVLWCLGAIMGVHFIAGVLALIALGWSR